MTPLFFWSSMYLYDLNHSIKSWHKTNPKCAQYDSINNYIWYNLLSTFLFHYLQLKDDESIKSVLKSIEEEELSQQMKVRRLVGRHLSDMLHLSLHDGTCKLHWSVAAHPMVCVFRVTMSVCVCAPRQWIGEQVEEVNVNVHINVNV